MGTFGAPGEAQVQKSVGECPKPNFFCAQAQIFRTPSVQEVVCFCVNGHAGSGYGGIPHGAVL